MYSRVLFIVQNSLKSFAGSGLMATSDVESTRRTSSSGMRPVKVTSSESPCAPNLVA